MKRYLSKHKGKDGFIFCGEQENGKPIMDFIETSIDIKTPMDFYSEIKRRKLKLVGIWDHTYFYTMDQFLKDCGIVK